MNRSDLAWALNAVLPHVGKRAPHDAVGLTAKGGSLFAFASDKYTLGIARIPDGPSLSLALLTSEAVDLMRFVRPTVKATQIEDVTVAVRGPELHVGLVNAEGETHDSAVFESWHSEGDLEFWLTHCRRIRDARQEFTNCVYDPDLCAKFAKAKRSEADRLRLYPRAGKNTGIALVTVGSDFLGAVAGMTYEHEQGDATVASFLSFNQPERISA